MRIRMEDKNFDYLNFVKQEALSESEQSLLTQLFARAVTKPNGSLGTVKSSQLELLIHKLSQTDYALFSTGENQQFVFRKRRDGEPLEAVAAVNKRTGPYHKTPLQAAINKCPIVGKVPAENIAAIKAILADPALDINLTDLQGWTAAYQVTQVSDPEVLELVLSAPGIKLDIRNSDAGSTPLMRACDRNNVAAVRILLAKNAKIDLSNDHATTLMYAVRKGHLQCAELLIEANANVNFVPDPFMETPLELAEAKRSKNHIALAALIRAKGGTRDVVPSEVQKIVREGGVQLQNYLAGNVNVRDSFGRTAAHYWAYEPKDDVKSLLESLKIDWNAKDNLERTPLHYAAKKGHLDAVHFLITKAPLKKAEQQSLLSLQTFLRNRNVDPIDKQGYTPLFWATQFDREDVVKSLLAYKANVQHLDNSKWTALDKAAESNSARVCELLCKADKTLVNRQAEDGRTPLAKAALNGSIDSIKVLIANGASLKISDNNGVSPFALAEEYPECQKLL